MRGSPHNTMKMQFNFTINHALSLWLLDAAPQLDPEAPDYALNLVSLIEAILEQVCAQILHDLAQHGRVQVQAGVRVCFLQGVHFCGFQVAVRDQGQCNDSCCCQRALSVSVPGFTSQSIWCWSFSASCW